MIARGSGTIAAWLGTAGLALLSACSAVPEDHYGRELVQTWARNLHEDADPRPYVQGMVRHLEHAGNTASTLFDEQARETVTLRAKVVGYGDALADRAVRAPGKVASAAAELTESALQRTRRLVGENGTARQILSPSRWATDLHRGLGHVPFVLGIDHPFLPSATDPERQVDLGPPPRRETFGERLLRRLWP